MNTYIVLFFSHFGATRFDKACRSAGINSKVMPVPRRLSSSCGVCVRYEAEEILPVEPARDEIDEVYLVDGEEYVRQDGN